MDECDRRGWVYYHGAIGKRTHRTEGEPDFIILANQGRLLLVECKKKGGKVTDKQLAGIVQARRLGHFIRVVHNIDEFLFWADTPSDSI